MAFHIATAVLLIVGLAYCEERKKSSDDYFCTKKDSIKCLKNDSVFSTAQRYCEFTPVNTTTAYTCPNHISCTEGTWFKAEKCGKSIRMRNINRTGVLSFGNRFHPNDQGKYFCMMGSQDECKNPSSNTLPVVVKLLGVDTHLATLNFTKGKNGCKTHPEGRMRCVEKCVEDEYCSNKQDDKCGFVLQHFTTSQNYAEGYFYFKETLNISVRQLNQNGRGPHPAKRIQCGNRNLMDIWVEKSNNVSFCPSEVFNNGSAGTLTFPKTNIGGNASSKEVCEDLTPLASRKCHGDFITPSSWADPVGNICKANNNTVPKSNVSDSGREVTYLDTTEASMKLDGSIDDNVPASTENVNAVSHMLSESTTNPYNIDGSSSPENNTVPMSNVSDSERDVTHLNTTEASMKLDGSIDDNVPVSKENVSAVSRMLSESTTNPYNIDASQLMWTSERLKEISEIGSSSPEINTVPMSNVSDSEKEVTHLNTTEASMKLDGSIDDNVPVSKENVNVVSRMLSESTTNPYNIDASQLMRISERLKDISEIGSSSPEVTSHVLEIVDNLNDVKEDVYEASLSGGTPTQILRALETQLTNLQKGETNFTDVKSSIGVAALQLEPPISGRYITFGGFSMETEDSTELQRNVRVKTGNDNSFSKFPATVTLPANLLDSIPKGPNNKIHVTFVIHRTSRLFMSSTAKERQRCESVESLVIAATVEGHNISHLSSPVISRFQLPHHVDKPMVRSSRRCVFWNFTLANGLGDWSSKGCELVISSEDNTGSIIECHCNHLTNFAVLLDVQGDIDHVALDTLSKVGCVVSTFALVITLIVLLAIKKLREQVPQKIIINLCLALLGLYICFLVGIDQSSLETGCVIFGALIHYFCLASVAWMCVVATNMYLLFVRVFNAKVNGFMWKAYLAAWGFPMIVVIVSVILNHQDYNKSYCFPETETLTFYLGVVLVIGVMLCYNLVIFILIIRQVTCKRIGRPAGQDKRTEMIERVQSIIIISILLGLTWLFGFLSIGDARYIFNPLFLVFNTLQGFFVFVFFILRPKNVRMILFKCCYRHQDGNIGSYTVNKSKTDGTNDQKDTLNMDDVVTSSEICDSHSNS